MEMLEKDFEKIVVPENTIAAIPVKPLNNNKAFNMENMSLFLEEANVNHKRDWFTSHFYKCLPLSIGNMQGLIYKTPFGFNANWNGGTETEDLRITVFDQDEKFKNENFPQVSSEFGHGIITIHFPIILKTPPGVNLMTIAPPNHPLAGLSPMTGVIEADNLRFTFTLNIKVNLADVELKIGRGTPLAGILPIPRHFCDNFKLVNAYEVIEKSLIEDERDVVQEHELHRIKQNKYIPGFDGGHYYRETDIRGNKFEDHQLPTDKRK